MPVSDAVVMVVTVVIVVATHDLSKGVLAGVVGIAKVVNRYKSMGLHVEIVGLNQESQTLVNRIGLSGGGSQ